jgi:phosphate transport system protein
MGRLATRAIKSAVQAAIEDDPDGAQEVIEDDQALDDLRDQVERECLDILRTHRPQKVQLRTVVAASHIAASLERVGDYGKEIARLSLQREGEPQLAPTDKIPEMADQIGDLIARALTAFSEDDVALAERVAEDLSTVDRQYDGIVESITEAMSEKKTRHFHRGAYLLNLVILLRRAGDRVATIAKRIVFARTGALADLDDEE